MDSSDTVQHLVNLVHVDIDAIHAYSHAIAQVDVPGIRAKLSEFRADHEKHIENLSTQIRKLGGTPPEFSRDFKGFLIEGFTALRSATGTEGALKAMKTNEEVTTTSYSQVTSLRFSPETSRLIEKNWADERRHLQYIEDCIANKEWDKSTKVA